MLAGDAGRKHAIARCGESITTRCPHVQCAAWHQRLAPTSSDECLRCLDFEAFCSHGDVVAVKHRRRNGEQCTRCNSGYDLDGVSRLCFERSSQTSPAALATEAAAPEPAFDSTIVGTTASTEQPATQRIKHAVLPWHFQDHRGYCRTDKNKNGKYTTHAVTSAAACKALCSDAACLSVEYQAKRQKCELHTRKTPMFEIAGWTDMEAVCYVKNDGPKPA